MKHLTTLVLSCAAACALQAGTYTENANTIKQIKSVSGTDNVVTNGTAWAGGIAPNLNEANTPSNPAANGKEFFTPANQTFRTLKDPPATWDTLVIEHPIHIAGKLTPAAKFDRQPMTFKSLSLYDNSQLTDNANAQFTDSDITIRSGAGTPLTISGGSGVNFLVTNCKIHGVKDAGLKVACGTGAFVLKTDNSFGDFKGMVQIGIGSGAAYDTKFRLTTDFNCPGDVRARSRGFFTVEGGKTSTINVNRFELTGGTLELTADSYATFTNLVFTSRPEGATAPVTLAPNDTARPVVTVLGSVSMADAARPFPIKCAYTANGSTLSSFPLIRAKGTLHADDFVLKSAPKAGSVLGTTFDAETGFTTLWLHETVSLKSNDGGYDSSFTNGVRWTDGQAPHADADYFVETNRIFRTMKDYNDLMVFGGRSLYLAGEFQTATRWSFEEEVYKKGLVTIPELHVLDKSRWLLNCDAGLTNTTMIVEATGTTPFRVNYNAASDGATIACIDVALKGSPRSKMSFASTRAKWTTFYLRGSADDFFGTCAFGTNYTFEVMGDLTSPGTFTFDAKSTLRVNGGTATLGTVGLASNGAIELGVKEVAGVETTGRLVVTTALTASSPLIVSVPLTKSVREPVVTDLLTFPKPATPLTDSDFTFTNVASRAHAKFEVVTDGDVQKLRMTREPSGLCIFLR